MTTYQDDWVHHFKWCKHENSHYGMYGSDCLVYYCGGCDQFYKQNPRLLFEKWLAKTKVISDP